MAETRAPSERYARIGQGLVASDPSFARIRASVEPRSLFRPSFNSGVLPVERSRNGGYTFIKGDSYPG